MNDEANDPRKTFLDKWDQFVLTPIYPMLFRFFGVTEQRLKKTAELLGLPPDLDCEGEYEWPHGSPFGKLSHYCAPLLLETLDRGGLLRPGLTVQMVDDLALRIFEYFLRGREHARVREFTKEFLTTAIADCGFGRIVDLPPSADLADCLAVGDEYRELGGLNADAWLQGFLAGLRERAEAA